MCMWCVRSSCQVAPTSKWHSANTPARDLLTATYFSFWQVFTLPKVPSFTCDRTAPRRDDPVPSRSRVARRNLCPARTPRGHTASPLRRRPEPPQPSPDRVQLRIPPSPPLKPLRSMPTAALRTARGWSSPVPSMLDGMHAAAAVPRPPRPCLEPRKSGCQRSLFSGRSSARVCVSVPRCSPN